MRGLPSEAGDVDEFAGKGEGDGDDGAVGGAAAGVAAVEWGFDADGVACRDVLMRGPYRRG